MADELEADIPSQASTYQDDDDSFSAESDFADTEPIKGRKADNKGKKKERGYKTFEEEEETATDGPTDKGKLTKRPSFFDKIGFQKPKVKEKEKEKQKEKQKPKAKDKSKEKERASREQEKQSKGSKSKERGRSWSKSKDSKDRDKIKKQESQVTEPVELRPVFGVDLVLAVERSNPHDGIQLPLIVRDCIDYIEANGMCVEGIYRLSGVKSRIEALRMAYDTAGDEVDLTDQDPHIVAGLLKLFLRELPEPILTQRIMLALEEASKIPDSKVKVQMFRGAIKELPVCNKTLLSWVVVHMAHIIGNEIETKMNLQNISIVLCPTLHISHRVLNVFFSFWRDIFGDVVLKKVKRRLRWRHSRASLELPDSSLILEEELNKQEAILNEMHERVNKGTADKSTEEQLWEVQRIVTQLKRKIRVCRKTSETAIAPSFKEEEEKPALEEKNTDDKSVDNKSDDAVFMETVSDVTEKLEEKTQKEDEVETKVQEPIKEEEIEIKPVLETNNQDEEVSDKKAETVEEVLDEKVVVVEEKMDILKEDQEEKIAEPTPGAEKEETVDKVIENKVTEVTETAIETEIEKNDEKIIEESKDEKEQVKEEEDKEKSKVDEENDEEIIQLLLITQAEAMARQQELKKIQSELQKRIEAEKSDIARLRQKLAEEERNESLQLRSSSFDSSDSSNSSNSSSESEDEDVLMEILTRLTKENEKLETKNNELVTNIHSERERCVDLRVEMTTMMLKQDLAKRRLSSGPAPLETDL